MTEEADESGEFVDPFEDDTPLEHGLDSSESCEACD